MYVDNLLFNHFSPYLENPALKPFFKLIFRTYWDLVEYYLNPYNLRNELIKFHPELKEILYSEKGIKWLNMTCRRGYEKIYLYTWY